MNHTTRTAMTEAYTEKFARHDYETIHFWRNRLKYANAEINECLRLFKDDESYCERLYLELDACREAQLKATKA